MCGLENKDSLFRFQTALSLAGIITVKLLKIHIYKVWWHLISDVTQYGCLSPLIIQHCTVLMWNGRKLKSHGGGSPYFLIYVPCASASNKVSPFFHRDSSNPMKEWSEVFCNQAKGMGHKFIHLVMFYHKSKPANPWAAGTLYLDRSTVRFCCFKDWHPLFCHSGLHQREPQIWAELRTYGTATFSQRVYVAQHLFKVTTVTTKLGFKLGSILVYGRI